MKKNIFAVVLSLFMITTAFANSPTLGNTNVIERNVDKANINIKLGNVSKLSDKEIETLANSLLVDFINENKNNIDECTITMSAEVSVKLVTVTVEVSYTSTDCKKAASQAAAALGHAVKQAKNALMKALAPAPN